MPWLALSAYLLDGELLTDIVDVLQPQGSVEAFVFFAVSVGISRATMNQRGSCGPLCPLPTRTRKGNSLCLICDKVATGGPRSGLNPCGSHHP